ncbi:hypothetical protein BD410DRAFT_683306, partial [Rickenella mellea]
MGLRACIVVCATSFLLGILFTHWIADSLTLWKAPITNEHLWTSAAYYSLLARVPAWLGWFLASVVATGAITILWSLGDGAAGNLMFDGGSIFLYGTAVTVYFYKVLPDFTQTFTRIPAPPLPNATPGSFTFPSKLKDSVLNLASANLVCSVALTGVLALQAGRWWAELGDSDDED